MNLIMVGGKTIIIEGESVSGRNFYFLMVRCVNENNFER